MRLSFWSCSPSRPQCWILFMGFFRAGLVLPEKEVHKAMSWGPGCPAGCPGNIALHCETSKTWTTSRKQEDTEALAWRPLFLWLLSATPRGTSWCPRGSLSLSLSLSLASSLRKPAAAQPAAAPHASFAGGWMGCAAGAFGAAAYNRLEGQTRKHLKRRKVVRVGWVDCQPVSSIKGRRRQARLSHLVTRDRGSFLN